VTFTATVTAPPESGVPTGTVTFRIDGGSATIVPLDGAGLAMFTTSTLAVGMHTITADYASETNVFAASSAPPLTQTVSQIATTTTLASSETSSFPGQEVTYTATVTTAEVGAPAGTVTFTIDGGSALTVPLDGAGKASFTSSALSVGTHTITANFAGADNSFAGSSDSLMQLVEPVATTVLLSSSNSTATVGQPVTFSVVVMAAEAGVPTGTVAFRIDGGSGLVIALDSAGQASYATSILTEGTHTVEADFTSATNVFADSSAVPLVQSISLPPNLPPLADAGGPYWTTEGSSLQLDGSGSSDPDEATGDQLTFAWDLDYDGVAFTQELTGTAPTVVFDDNFAERTIALRVTDAAGLSDIATTTLTVDNVRPIVGDDSVTIAEDQTTVVPAATLLANDSDPGSSDLLTIVAVTSGPNLVAALDAGGGINLTPKANFNGTETITYTVSDGDGGTATAHVTVIVAPAADAPTAIAGGPYVLEAGSDLVVNAGASFDADVPGGRGKGEIITGAGPGAGPHVRAFDGATHALVADFLPYGTSFGGGVRVATGDVNSDGLADIITGGGPGAGPHVKVFDGRTNAEVMSFFAYATGFGGGVYVAAGDVDGDGRADIITGAGEGAPGHVKVFSGSTGEELASFFAYGPEFLGGVRVAAGDVNGDGLADIITGAGPGAGPHVKVFDGRTQAEVNSFLAYDAGFAGGVFVAAGDVDGDGKAEVITGTDAGPTHVKVFDAAFDGAIADDSVAELRSFFAYPGFLGGVRVAAGDVNGDGLADIIAGAGPGAGPHVKIFDGASNQEIRSFFAYSASFGGGVYVATGDLQGEARLRYAWDLNDDGVFDRVETSAQCPEHTFAWDSLADLGIGTHTITLRVTDSSGLSSVVETTLTIVAPAAPVRVEGDTVTVVGTEGNDSIVVRGASLGLQVVINGESHRVLAPAGARVVVYGLAGDDTILANTLRQDVRLYGGLGNDILIGGFGNDLLLGGAGDDAIAAGLGRDAIIGGDGADVLVGRAAILINGTTAYDRDREALELILDAWSEPAESFDSRAARLQAGLGETGVRLASGGDEPTVFDDGDGDILFGQDGVLDWFFAELGSDSVLSSGRG
jgi:hypothetical protein